MSVVRVRTARLGSGRRLNFRGISATLVESVDRFKSAERAHD